MRICYDNELTTDLISSNSAENSNYPVENCLNTILTTTFRTNDVTAATYIIFDAGAGETFTVDSVFISGHNIQSGTTIKFEMNATDAWGAPSISETLTWRSGHIYKYITSSSYRFIRFYIDDTTNPDDYIELGYLFAGEYLQVTPSSNLPFKVTNLRNDGVTVTDQGAIYGEEGYSRRIFQYDFENMTDTNLENIRTMYDTIGKHGTLYLMNYDELFTHHDIVYGHIVNDLEETVRGGKKNSFSLAIEELR